MNATKHPNFRYTCLFRFVSPIKHILCHLHITFYTSWFYQRLSLLLLKSDAHFLKKFAYNLQERVRAFIRDGGDKDVLMLHVQDPFHRLLLHGVCEVKFSLLSKPAVLKQHYANLTLLTSKAFFVYIYNSCTFKSLGFDI